jgi:hypothetical protein
MRYEKLLSNFSSGSDAVKKVTITDKPIAGAIASTGKLNMGTMNHPHNTDRTKPLNMVLITITITANVTFTKLSILFYVF